MNRLRTLAHLLVASAALGSLLLQPGPLRAETRAGGADPVLLRAFATSPQIVSLGGHMIASSAQVIRKPGENEVYVLADFDLRDGLVHRVIASGEGTDVAGYMFVAFEGTRSVFRDASTATGWLRARDLDGRYASILLKLEDGQVIAPGPSNVGMARTPQGVHAAASWLCLGCKAIAASGGKRCPGVCDFLSWPFCCYCYMALCAYTAS